MGNKGGAPGYPKEVVKEMQRRIIEEITINKRSLHHILDPKNDKDMEFPSAGLVYQWLNPEHHKYDAEFAHNYARAREIRTEKIFEEMLEIADSADDITYIDREGNTRIDWGKVQRNKTQIETRQWMLARMMPKKYGNKLETTLQGGDKPIDVVDYSKLSPEALEEIAKQANAGKSKPQ